MRHLIPQPWRLMAFAILSLFRSAPRGAVRASNTLPVLEQHNKTNSTCARSVSRWQMLSRKRLPNHSIQPLLAYAIESSHRRARIHDLLHGRISWWLREVSDQAARSRAYEPTCLRRGASTSEGSRCVHRPSSRSERASCDRSYLSHADAARQEFINMDVDGRGWGPKTVESRPDRRRQERQVVRADQRAPRERHAEPGETHLSVARGASGTRSLGPAHEGGKRWLVCALPDEASESFTGVGSRAGGDSARRTAGSGYLVLGWLCSAEL